MMVKISVIIPAHNEEARIKECLHSVLSQDMKNFEIIVVNDGSTDKTKEIVERIKKKNRKIKISLINNPHGTSAAYARNRGVEKSHGKYLYFLDADNKLVNKNFLAQLLEVYEKKKAGAVLSNAALWKTSFFTKISGININPLPEKGKLISLSKEDILKTIIFSMRKDVFIKLGMFDEKSFYWEDTLLTEKYAELGLPTYRILDNFMAIEPANSLVNFAKQSKSLGKGIARMPDRERRKKLLLRSYLKFFVFWIVPLVSLWVIGPVVFFGEVIVLLIAVFLRLKKKLSIYAPIFCLIYFVKVLYVFIGTFKR
jgi:glycosyltransferase involved in cell wall biosynthesis